MIVTYSDWRVHWLDETMGELGADFKYLEQAREYADYLARHNHTRISITRKVIDNGSV